MRKWVGIIAAIVLVPPGILATLHTIGRESKEPLVRFAVVVGRSMLPTLRQGDGVLFARLRWHEGDVVLADVGEPDPVVKRVDRVRLDQVRLIGDNWRRSAVYTVAPERIMGRLVFRVGGFRALAREAPKEAPVGPK